MILVFTYREEEKQSFGQKRIQILLAAGIAIAVPIALILGLLLYFINPWFTLLGLLLGVIVAVFLVYKKSRACEIEVLNAIGARKVTKLDFSRLLNLTSALSLKAGVAVPQCYVVDDEARNGLAVAGRSMSAVVLTTGALDSLNLVETEGVIAELLMRIKSGDAADATLASAFFGLPILDRGLSGPFRYCAELASEKLLCKDRELRADREAVMLTRYPTGLRDALAKMERGNIVTKSASEGTDYLWLVPPSTNSVAKNEASTRASLGLRIDVLSDEI